MSPQAEGRPISRFPELARRTEEITPFLAVEVSQAYAMTGWWLGYVIAPRFYVRTLQKLHQNFFISSNEFVQWAGVAALRQAGAEVARFRAVFDERRRVMV